MMLVVRLGMVSNARWNMILLGEFSVFSVLIDVVLGYISSSIPPILLSFVVSLIPAWLNPSLTLTVVSLAPL